MSKIPALSVFFPAYNEEKNIKNTISNTLTILPEIADEFEIVVVDDGSTDKTAEITKEIASKNSNVRLITHKTNLGYGASLKTGFYSAKNPVICFTDADGQFDFSEIKNFLPHLENSDLVVGYRKKRAEGLMRQINAKAWASLIKILFDLKIRDLDCGFKVIKRRVIDKIPKLDSEGAMISAELLVKAKKMGFKISQVPVSHYSRKVGVQTGADLRVIARAFFELFKLYPKLQGLHA